MSAGHKHRVVKIKKNSPIVHLLQTPLAWTADKERAESSRWVWGLHDYEEIAGDGPIRRVPVYVMTPLSILHTLFGLTLDLR